MDKRLVSAFVVFALLAGATVAVAVKGDGPQPNLGMTNAKPSELFSECKDLTDKADWKACMKEKLAELKTQRMAFQASAFEARQAARLEMLQDRCDNLNGPREEKCQNRVEAISACIFERGPARRECLVSMGFGQQGGFLSNGK